MRTYSELSQLTTHRDRFEYLKLKGYVGDVTFGHERYLNQDFYRSTLWKSARTAVIARDYGRDLGVEDYEIHDRVYVHHMNPLRTTDITEGNFDIINPEYLICVTHLTHNAIHYGDASLLPRRHVDRQPGDTNLWRTER